MEELKPQWTTEKVFFNNEEFLQALFAQIAKAQHHLRLEFYIFEKSELSQKILEHLQHAQKRGVIVRLLIDGVGSPEWQIEDLKELKQKGIHARIFRPYPWIRKPATRWSVFLKIHQIGQWYKYLNRRNHRKTVIIDHDSLLSGSSNISSTHFRSYSGDKAWKDTNVFVEGREVTKAIDAFEKAWKKSWSGKKYNLAKLLNDFDKLSIRQNRRNLSNLIRLNYYSFLRLFYFYNLLSKIRRAKTRIWITNAYFVPLGRIMMALKKAKRAGVDIKILTPYESDMKIAKWLSLILSWRLTHLGIEVYEYLPSVLHSKTLLIDDFAMIGSSNLSYRSIRHDLEIDIVIQKTESIRQLETQFVEDLKNSKLLNSSQKSFSRFLLSILGDFFHFLAKKFSR